MIRHSRRRIFVVTLLLIFGLSSGAIVARQPFPAAIQQALITLGLWPYGVYANGEIPVWDAATNRFLPGSGGGGLQTDVNIAEVGGVAIGSAVPVTGTITAVTSITNPVAVTGTFFQATQPVSGTVTANAGTNLNTSALLTTTNFTDSFGTAGTADTQVRSIQGIASMTPVLIAGTGIAGTAATGVVTVQGIASMTPLLATVTGTVTVNAGTGFASDSTFGAAFPATGPGIYRAESTTPSAVDDGDLVGAWTDLLGRQVTKTTDPCTDNLLTTSVNVNVAAAQTTELVVASAGNSVYICKVNLIGAGANNVAFVEDDTDDCGSPSAGLSGGTTAATGWNFGSNWGSGPGNGDSWVMKTSTTNRYVCIITSTSSQTSGNVKYALAP